MRECEVAADWHSLMVTYREAGACGARGIRADMLAATALLRQGTSRGKELAALRRRLDAADQAARREAKRALDARQASSAPGAAAAPAEPSEAVGLSGGAGGAEVIAAAASMGCDDSTCEEIGREGAAGRAGGGADGPTGQAAAAGGGGADGADGGDDAGGARSFVSTWVRLAYPNLAGLAQGVAVADGSAEPYWWCEPEEERAGAWLEAALWSPANGAAELAAATAEPEGVPSPPVERDSLAAAWRAGMLERAGGMGALLGREPSHVPRLLELAERLASERGVAVGEA